MRDLRIGAILAVIFSGLLIAYAAFAQQPASGPTPDQAGAYQKMAPQATGQPLHFFNLTDQFAPSTESRINAEKDKQPWLNR